MKNLLFSFIILLSISSHVWASPQRIEMIFLSPQKVSLLLQQIEKMNSERMMGLIASAELADESCVPMGDGCFHPQYGYMEKKATGGVANTPVLPLPKEEELRLKTFNAVENSMISCDKDNYFDIFCGKAKAASKPAEVEIWFDISSSLRTVDYTKDGNYCNRRSFMTKVMDGCKDKVRISVYNTSLKEVGDHSSVCMAYGTNDASRLLQWMRDSSAKTLLIVTDIDEVSREMRDFLEERGAKIIGDGVKPFNSTDLIDYANDFIKTCKK